MICEDIQAATAPLYKTMDVHALAILQMTVTLFKGTFFIPESPQQEMSPNSTQANVK
jgi:hypothetical protein